VNERHRKSISQHSQHEKRTIPKYHVYVEGHS
jgi:hypothetical protein